MRAVEQQATQYQVHENPFPRATLQVKELSTSVPIRGSLQDPVGGPATCP